MHELADWLKTVSPREFTTLSEAIAAVTLGDVFRVSGGDPLKYLGEVDWSVQGGNGANIIRDVVCDGERVYYSQFDGTRDEVFAADPEDGSDAWVSPITPPSVATQLAIAADGLYVYTLRTTATGVGATAWAYDPSDGSSVRGLFGGYTGNAQAIDANGVHCVIISNSSVDIQSSVVATGAVAGSTWTRGAAANAIAAGRNRLFVGGTRSGTDVEARDITDPSTGIWGITLPTTGAPTVNAIATDGERVYVGTDRIALSAGGNANLFVLNANPPTSVGVLLYAADIVGAASDIDRLSVDDRYVVAFDSNNRSYFIDKRRGDYLGVALTTIHLFCADGVSYYGRDENAPFDDLVRYYRGGVTRTFQRVDGDDPGRYPFFNLAIPTLE
jgi:hypothetical protein